MSGWAGGLLLWAVAAALPLTPAHAHVGTSPAPHDIWSAWTFDPFVIVPLLLFGFLFARGGLQLFHKSRRARAQLVGRYLLFIAGYLSLVLALVWPLDALGDSLFMAHMAQHMVLMLAAAPLMVLARPLPGFLMGLPRRARRALVGGWARQRVLPSTWRIASAPIAATIIQLVVLYAWHAPDLFRAASASDLVHAAMHASFLFSAMLFWWSITSAARSGGTRAAAAALCLALTLKLSGVLGLVFAVVARPIYADLYPATAAWGLTAAEDHELAGVVMMATGLPVYLAAALAVLALWLARMDAASPPLGNAAASQ